MTKSEGPVPTMPRRVAPISACLLLLACTTDAQPRDVALRQMFHQAWGLREGAPGAITSIAQSADGYLWLASPAGLFRFDGVRFEKVRMVGPPVRRPSDLWALADGSLWVLHDRALLTRLLGHERTTFAAADGVPGSRTLSLGLDRAGVTWAAGEMGLARLNGTRWEMVVTAKTVLDPNGPSTAVLLDSRGALWASTGGQVLVRRPGQPAFALHSSFGVRMLAESPDGIVWGIPIPGDSVRPLETSAGHTPKVAAIEDGRRLAFDSNGGLYVATGRGLVHLTATADGRVDGAVDRVGAGAGLTHDSALATLVDREGNVWVGTAAGLDLLRATVVANADPLPPVHAARLARQGDDVWVGTRSGVLRVSGNRLLPGGFDAPVSGVIAEAGGTLLAWSGKHLWRGRGTTFGRVAGTPQPKPDEAWNFAFDASGRLWAGFLRTGIWCLDRDRWVRPAIDGLDLTATASVFGDDRGRVWISSVMGDVIAVTNGGTPRLYADDDRLPIGQVVGLATAPTRTWIAGRGGIAAVDDSGSIRAVPGIDEDTVGVIRGIATEADGSVWLNADHGIVRISVDEAARATGPSPLVPRYRVFDHLDGMVGGAAPRPANAALRAPGGIMWFVGYDAVYAVDPRRLSGSSLPPPVKVTSLRAGDRDYTASDGVVLAVGARNVAVSYTGISLTMPDRIRFRHRLDGVDSEWQEAGVRREAFYANLAPGRYTFRVIASNNNGVWPETGATTTFVVPRALHETLAFRAAVLLVLALGLWMALRLRVRQVTEALQDRLEARVFERERIARDLHDTLLQGVQGLILRFQAVVSQLPVDGPPARAMEEALARADDVLAEGRARVRDLRRSTQASADLGQAVAALGPDVVAGSGIAYATTIAGVVVPLHPVVRDEAYWIAHEAVVNAVHHAGARSIEAEVSFSRAGLTIRVRDDGTGIDEQKADRGRAEHFGLRGMRERAGRIGGQLKVWSRPGVGTEVELHAPASAAFATTNTRTRVWWQRFGVREGGL